MIEEINGVPVTEISVDEIPQLLNPAGRNDVLLTISNLSSPSKQVLVKKDCKKSNAITEDQLASAYAMYSLETTNEQEFVCPFKTTVTSDGVDFGNFKTFAFSTIDENNRNWKRSSTNASRTSWPKKDLRLISRSRIYWYRLSIFSIRTRTIWERISIGRKRTDLPVQLLAQ